MLSHGEKGFGIGVGGRQRQLEREDAPYLRARRVGGGTLQQAVRGDARVTRIGQFIRRTSLDELPQLFNVLNGSMSLVGPRPHATEHNEFYRQQIKGYMLRHTVKPGITGWAQVNGLRGETDTIDKMEARVRFDLDYIRRWSLWFDLLIIAKTIGVVFKRQNAH